MDAFESVIAAILHRQGYWTTTCLKVELTKADKREIGRHSSPRWELDVVAYKPRDNELLVVECKSFLDSLGVQRSGFDGTKPEEAKRYKLFNDATLRRVVLARLEEQLVERGACRPAPTVTLCLAAGKIRSDERWLQGHFGRQGWRLIGPAEIRCRLDELRDSGYENSVAAVVAKILLREPKTASRHDGVTAVAAD